MNKLVLATADVEFEERVRTAFKGRVEGPLRYWRDGMLGDGPARMIEELGHRGAEVVALGPGIPTDAALELARAIDHDRPDISTVIVAAPSTELLQSALHAGARDVISPDTPTPELRSAFERALDAASARRGAFEATDEDEPETTRVILTLCPKGGAGKTTMATNLALGLAQLAPGDTVIVDLDLQFGDVASALGLAPEATFTDATRSLDKLDATTLKANLVAHSSGLYVLCAPLKPTEADDVTSDQIEKVIGLLTQSFRYVVIDSGSGLDEHTLAALEFATDLCLVSATDIPSIRSTQKEIEALRSIGKADQRWHFVLNRADARTGLTIPAIEAAVGISVDVAVPSSRAVPVSLNRGMPVIESDPRAPVSLAMSQLVRQVAPNADRPTPSRNGGFFRKGR
ncbi:MAG TPA: AAA family ATPase [Acidimicrobiia bacterium]